MKRTCLYLQTIQHGACLGLGLAALGTNDEEVFEDIKGVLFLDSAVAGEAAGTPPPPPLPTFPDSPPAQGPTLRSLHDTLVFPEPSFIPCFICQCFLHQTRHLQYFGV